MVNGPLGGSMATPPVAPQPPQVSFETTAQSRGNFNNFLKSIPTTTAMTPIAPLGSAPTMPTFNPMANIDIFNQPTGMMGMNQPPMNPMMQPPSNAGIGLMPNPVQMMFDGGFVDDFSQDTSGSFSVDDQGNVSDDFSIGGEGFGGTGSDEQSFQDALDQAVDQASQFGGGQDAINIFADDPAVVDRRGVNVGIENTGGFTTGVVPNLRGERFTRFESPDYALRALGRDFRTKLGRNPDLTVGDYFETFTPSSENPAGTADRVAEFTRATGKGAGDRLSLGDMGNIMDIQYKFETGQGNTPAARIQQVSTTVPLDNEKVIADLLDNINLDTAFKKDDTKNVIPQVDSFGDPARIDPRTMTEGAIKTGTGQIAGMDENTFRSLSNEAQQKILSDIATADLGTTFTPYDPEPNRGIVPDTALETMADRRDIFQPDDITFDPITIEEDDLTTVSPDLLSSIGREQRIDDANTFRQTVPDAAKIFGDKQVSNLPIGFPARGGTASGEELDQAPAFGRSPGSLQAQFGDRIGPMLAGLNQTRQDALGALSQQKDTFGGILNAIGIKSPNQRMIDALSSGQGKRLFGGTYEPTPIYQDGKIVGVKDQFGNLMEGRDPNAPMGSDDNQEPIIRRPIVAAKEEEEKEDEKPPNVIGGGDTPAPPAPTSVVVDSPFTSNVSDFVPSTFNTADLNKLIESLTGIPAPRRAFGGPVPMQNGGVINAVDKFLATT